MEEAIFTKPNWWWLWNLAYWLARINTYLSQFHEKITCFTHRQRQRNEKDTVFRHLTPKPDARFQDCLPVSVEYFQVYFRDRDCGHKHWSWPQCHRTGMYHPPQLSKQADNLRPSSWWKSLFTYQLPLAGQGTSQPTQMFLALVSTLRVPSGLVGSNWQEGRTPAKEGFEKTPFWPSRSGCVHTTH